MAALIISISSDSSEESVGSHAQRVILFGIIPTIIPIIPRVPIAPVDPIVALEVGEVSVISPTGVLDLVDYSSSSNSDPSEDSFPVAPSSKFPLAPVVALLGIRRRPTILVRPGEAIPFGRPYCTHPNGPRKLLTVTKRVGPFPARRLAWRRVHHRSSDRHSSPDFTSDSPSSSSSSDSSSNISSGSSSDSLSDSSSVHSSCFYALEVCTIVYSLPTYGIRFIPYSSSERSLDSSSPSAGPSRKRCRSPSILVPLSTHVLRSIALSFADLLPRNRFRDSYSSEVRKEHMEMGIADVETVADLDVEVATGDIKKDKEEFQAEATKGGTMEIVVDLLATGDIFKPTRGDVPDLEGTLYDMSHYMSEVPLDRITEVRSLGRENLRVRALLCIERDHVDNLLRHMALSQEEFHQVCRERDDTQRRLGRLESLVERRFGFRLLSRLKVRAKTAVTVIMEMVEMEMVEMEIQMRMIEVLGLWFEKMETVFHISNCPEKYQAKYATCTLLNSALTWWNSHKRTIGADAAFSMSWRELMKLMA
ncbi:hypothetical protein Tco_0776409 [Tanacetum coccineum]